MKSSFIRIFALAILTTPMLAFGASSSCKDEKAPPPCSPQAVAVSETTEDQHCGKKMKKEKKMKKKMKEQKQDDSYPGYGIYG